MGNKEEIVAIIILIVFIFIMGISYYVVSNIFHKSTQGCYDWERVEVTKSYNLKELGYSCDEIRDIIIIEIIPEIAYSTTDYYCKGKLIKEEKSTYLIAGIREAYSKECLTK